MEDIEVEQGEYEWVSTEPVSRSLQSPVNSHTWTYWTPEYYTLSREEEEGEEDFVPVGCEGKQLNPLTLS